MHLCYIDESGTPEITGNTSHYVLAGLTIPIDKWKTCERDIQKIKDKYFLSTAEIHTAWLVRRYLEQSKIPNFETLSYAQRRFEAEKYRRAELLRLNSPRNKKQYSQTKKNYAQTEAYIHLTFNERCQFVYEIAQKIGSWRFARLFAECIDKIHFNIATSPVSIDEQAFEQIVSRFEQYLQIYTKSSRVTQFGLLIHDNNETVCKKHTSMMRQFHRTGTFWTKIRNTIETPLFVDSRASRVIQLADHIAYAVFRRYNHGDSQYFDIIAHKFHQTDGVVHGLAHKQKSNPRCMCLACSSRRTRNIEAE